VQAFENLPFPIRFVMELRQFRRLGGFEELPEFPFVDGELGVEIRGLAAQVALAGLIDSNIVRYWSPG